MCCVHDKNSIIFHLPLSLKCDTCMSMTLDTVWFDGHMLTWNLFREHISMWINVEFNEQKRQHKNISDDHQISDIMFSKYMNGFIAFLFGRLQHTIQFWKVKYFYYSFAWNLFNLTHYLIHLSLRNRFTPRLIWICIFLNFALCSVWKSVQFS